MELAGIAVERLAVLALAERLAYAGHPETAALLLIADANNDERVGLTYETAKRSSMCSAIRPTPTSTASSGASTCTAFSTAWPSTGSPDAEVLSDGARPIGDVQLRPPTTRVGVHHRCPPPRTSECDGAWSRVPCALLRASPPADTRATRATRLSPDSALIQELLSCHPAYFELAP